MLAPPYPALLTLHLLAIAVFLGGLALHAATLPTMGDHAPADLARARRFNGLIVTPALLLVWLFGVSLAAAGGWFAAGWLQAKMALVVALSALHGVLSVRLRRIGTPAARPTSYRPLLAVAVLASAIVALATAKPG